MIASGTNGTCTWTISDAGELSIRPTSGASGYLLAGLIGESWPWQDYAEEVRSVVFSGSIYFYKEQWSGQPIETGGAQNLFTVFDGLIISERRYSNLTSITGLESLKNLTNVLLMFGGCTALTTLDLSLLDTTNVTEMDFMFSNCDLLSSVKFGSLFSTENAQGSKPLFGKGTNTTNGIVIQDDADFMKLTVSQRAGTWKRGVTKSFNSIAKRSNNGFFDEDGNDVIITTTWATDSEQDNRELKIYQKLSSTSSYPSTPIVSQNLIGDSGITPITISNIGDEAYDFKVIFYDGINTFIAFPAVQSNVRLITIDEKGRVECGDYQGNLKSIFNIFYPKYSYYETSLTYITPSGVDSRTGTPTKSDLAVLGEEWFNPKYAWGGEWVLENAGFVHVSGEASGDYAVSGADGSSGRGIKDGGEEEVTLTTNEIPAHTHGSSGSKKDGITGGLHHHTNYRNKNVASGSAVLVAAASSSSNGLATTDETHKHDLPNHEHSSVGGGQAHENMQPYINVYRWHRTA